jgi:FkbM family methyltransferase
MIGADLVAFAEMRDMIGLSELAKAYVQMVDLHKRGATAEARGIYFQICHEMRSLVSQVWSTCEQHVAAGDHYAALADIDTILEIHRKNLMNIELPASKQHCYAQMASIFERMGQPVAVASAKLLAANGDAGFYRPSPSCQISALAGLYEVLFGCRSDGTFVEVGAFDGEMFSNTSCLADLGWRGLYIEPVERSFRLCQERHRRNPRISVLNAAIGPTETTIKFWDNGQFSTGSLEETVVNAESGWQVVPEVQEIEVPQIRLERALADAGIEPGFDLLVVDVDGMEEAVFGSFELAQWRPRFMIVELIELVPAFAGHDALIAASARVRELIGRAGYETVYRDLGNTVFRRATPA